MEKGACHPYRGTWPEIADDVFVAPGTHIIGDVRIGARSSIWFNCVLRADVNHIRIGQRTNLQDGTVVHVNGGGSPTIIGDDVLVGHKVMLHGCELQDGAFVGMNSIILDGCVVESGGMVAAGAFVTPGKVVRKGELWAGWPAKCLREITDNDRKLMERGAPHYAELAAEYRSLQS